MVPARTDPWCPVSAYPGTMIRPSRRLVEALSADLEPYLRHRLSGLGIDPGAVRSAIERAAADVGRELEALLGLPFDRQAETPLEVVRRAIEAVSDAVAALGVDPVDRDDEQRRLDPGDVFGLAPASAADLGEESLEASLAWGVAKTAALSRPTLLVVTSNLMDASRFDAAAAAAGYRVESGRGADSSTTPLVAFVDLESEESDAAIRSLSERGVRVVGYGPHVDDQAMVRARALGATAAEPRSRMFRNPGAYLPPLV